jgi:hypothetical protein
MRDKPQRNKMGQKATICGMILLTKRDRKAVYTAIDLKCNKVKTLTIKEALRLCSGWA